MEKKNFGENIWTTIQLYLEEKLKGKELDDFENQLNENEEFSEMVEFARSDFRRNDINAYLNDDISFETKKEIENLIVDNDAFKQEIEFRKSCKVYAENKDLIQVMNLLDKLGENLDTPEPDAPKPHETPPPRPIPNRGNSNFFKKVIYSVLASFVLVCTYMLATSLIPTQNSLNKNTTQSTSSQEPPFNLNDFSDPGFSGGFDLPTNEKMSNFFDKKNKQAQEFISIKEELSALKIKEEENQKNQTRIRTLKFHIGICEFRLNNLMEAERLLFSVANSKDDILAPKAKLYLSLLYYFGKDVSGETYNKKEALKFFEEIKNYEGDYLKETDKDKIKAILKWEKTQPKSEI